MGGVMPAFNVQSIDGFLARLATGPAHLTEWTPLAAPPWHRFVRSVILLGLFLLAAMAIIRCGGRQAGDVAPFERRSLEFSIVLVLAVVASPLSWSHYYLLLLLPWALYLGGGLDLPDDAPTHWLMAGGMALVSLPVIILPFEPGLIAAIGSRTLVSAWLFGGLMMLAALIRGALSIHAPVLKPQQPATAP
jgi:hypothetical protein